MAKNRSEIDDKYKWNLADIFKTDEDWKKTVDEISEKLKLFKQFENKLNDSKELEKYFALLTDVGQAFGAVYVYANMKSHEDMNESKYQGFVGVVESLGTEYSICTSFFVPEIISYGEETVRELINNDNLRIYEHFIDDIFRSSEHVLSKEMEELLSQAGDMAQSPDNIYSMLNNADVKFGNILNENGEEVEVTHGNFVTFLESGDQSLRERAYKKMYEFYLGHKNTIASTYNASIKKNIFFANARKYESPLHNALYENNIDREVYKNLINTVSEYLPYMHQYVAKRKEKLGLDTIHFYDLYTPIVEEVTTKIEYEDAKETVLKGLNVLGEEYKQLLLTAYNNKWIDVYENKGKRSGAYSWGTKTAHPYILLNYDDKIKDMFTLAHELGHSIHSHYTWTNQPYIYADYTIFLAEIASTVNEALLMDYLLDVTKDEKERAYLINYFLEQFRGTVFRQTMFAEFEMLAHDMVQGGETATAKSLSDLYAGLCKKYYGDDIVVDDEISIEWARIPHFYTEFYVFQYSTGYASAISIAKSIQEEGQVAIDRYIELLKSGSSDYSIELLKKAGVDMTTKAPIASALEVFKDLVEKL